MLYEEAFPAPPRLVPELDATILLVRLPRGNGGVAGVPEDRAVPACDDDPGMPGVGP